MKKIFITGAAGFIGYHMTHRLLKEGYDVLGVDNFNAYYKPLLKRDRISYLKTRYPETKVLDFNIVNPEIESIIENYAPDVVLHLAAQAGVRYSLENPWAYIESNLVGYQRILEAVKKTKPKHFVFASSSSVYGSNSEMPYKTSDRVDAPVSLYAVTKRSNELMGKVYSDLFKIPSTALRFFTVYGSWGRPDMAYFSFTKKILRDEPLQVYNNGNLKRDFTHISDIVESIVRLLNQPPAGTEPYRVLNIGASKPIPLMEFIETLESVIGKKAIVELKPHQPGDVLETYADVSALEEITQYRPKISLKEGLTEFYEWFESSKAIERY